jgi:endonuclease G
MTTLKKYTLIATLLLSPLLALDSSQFINEDNCNQILDKEYFQVCYDQNLKTAKAVTYTLYGDLVNETNIEKRPSFKIDREVEKEYRASTKDYTKSGYDRGHLANDAAFDWSQESLNATYKLTNIIPQVRKVNRYTWIKAERYARFIATQLGEVQIINLVTYPKKPTRIGKNKIAVPNGFYKLLYNNDQNYSKCLYYKNDNNINTKEDRLRQHEVECSSITDIINPSTQTRRTCSSFETHLEAQTYYDNREYGWERLDRDKDGNACESLK